MQFPRIVDWHRYVITLAMPYEKGKIDGDIFLYDWIWYILNITIYIWFDDTFTRVDKFFAFEKDTTLFHVMQFGMNVGHLHYEPLKEILQEKNILHGIKEINKEKYI